LKGLETVARGSPIRSVLERSQPGAYQRSVPPWARRLHSWYHSIQEFGLFPAWVILEFEMQATGRTGLSDLGIRRRQPGRPRPPRPFLWKIFALKHRLLASMIHGERSEAKSAACPKEYSEPMTATVLVRRCGRRVQGSAFRVQSPAFRPQVGRTQVEAW